MEQYVYTEINEDGNSVQVFFTVNHGSSGWHTSRYSKKVLTRETPTQVIRVWGTNGEYEDRFDKKTQRPIGKKYSNEKLITKQDYIDGINNNANRRIEKIEYEIKDLQKQISEREEQIATINKSKIDP